MPSRGYQITKVYVTLQPHFLEKLSADPTAEEARIYYNTVDKRPKICIADP